MIRKTVARAFGRSPGGPTRPISDDTEFVQRVRKAFDSLHDMFRQEIEKLARIHKKKESPGEFRYQVSGIRSSDERTEFTVTSPHATFRWTITQPGLVVLSRTGSGGLEDRHFLSLHPDAEGVLQLVARPDRPGRHSFRYTSLTGIVAWGLGRESGS